MSSKKSNCENYLLSAKPVSLSFLEYQIVYEFVGKTKYFRSFNITKDGKVVKKFHLEKKLRFDESTDIINVIQGTLFKELSCEEAGVAGKSQSRKKRMNYDKRTKDARNEVASKMFKDLEL